MSMRTVFLAFCFTWLGFLQPLAANNATYEQRRSDYIDTALAHYDRDAITLQAYRNVPVDTAELHSILAGFATNETSDFDIVKLVRVLCFSQNHEYDTLLLPSLMATPFWINYGDTLHGYWSENHMSQWMSSDWILHEKYGKPVDADLDYRLRHYLHLKIDYGFYEFFSSTYAPYCLSGLLNLADFSQDAEIKSLAGQAAQRLLKDILKLTNNQGVFFPSAWRNYCGKYENAYGQNHNNLIYLLTGMGETPGGASHAGGFLASSTLPVDSIIASWTPQLDMTYHIGHSLDSGFVINSGLTPLDRTIFQWSSGAYFHPAVAAETAQLLVDSNMWKHVDFAPFYSFSGLSIPTIVGLANSLTVASESSLICGQDVVIYKHNSITLSSIKDFWKGKLGFQQFPCVANVGRTAVYTASGIVEPDWNDRKATNANENLPYVAQKKNLALLMYRPEPKPQLLPYYNNEVALHFKTADFDEVATDSMWLLGREDENYVAVRRWCTDSINGVPACNMNGGQSWVIMLGDSALYGSFSNFQSLIHQSQFEEKWYLDTLANEFVYYAKITVDTVTIDYAWGVDTSTETGIRDAKVANRLTVYPNPTSDFVNVDLSEFANQPASINVFDMVGTLVYSEKVIASKKTTIRTNQWPQGMYVITADTPKGRLVTRISKVK